MASVSVAIRRIDPADPHDPALLDQIGELTRDAYLADGLVAPGAAYLQTLADARSRAADAELWVAEEDGQVLGTVTFAPPGSRYAEVAGPLEGEFRTLAVAPDARGRGIGEQLARLCVERSRELGLEAVVLSTKPQMKSAHRIYDRLGFVYLPGRDWEPVPGVLLWTYRLPL